MTITAPQVVWSVGFEPPNRGAPESTTDGGTRGSVFFAPPERGQPVSTTDGGTRGDIGFSVPDRGQPVSTTDGGTRGDIGFSVPDRGQPVSTTDGGTRAPQDPNLPSELQLLVPGSTMPLTLSAYPTFFAYLPALPENAVVKFTLYRHDLATNSDVDLVYEVEQAAPNQAGIVDFALPSEPHYALESGEIYHWYVSIALDDQDASSNIAVDSWVERLAENDPIAQQLKGLQGSDRVEAYAASGLWFETLKTQMQARSSTVTTTAQVCTQGSHTDDWSQLLQSVDLCSVVAAPLVR